RPMFEEAVPRAGYAEIALQLLVDVDEARRGGDAGPDAEAEAVRLAGAMIGILAEDDDAHLLERRQVERAEPFGALGEDALAGRLLRHEEAAQRRHIGAFELGTEGIEPAG